VSEQQLFSLQEHLKLFGVTSISNLLLDAYHALAIQDNELILLLQLSRLIEDQEKHVDLLVYFEERMGIHRYSVRGILQRLRSRGLVYLPINLQDCTPSEAMLHPLYKKLLNWSDTPPQERAKEKEKPPEEEVVVLFEHLFRDINEVEYQRLRDWIVVDGWPPEVVKEALSIAALSRNLNFRYIDRILFNWQARGCRTLDDVHALEAKRNQEKEAALNQEKEVPVHRPASRRRSSAKAPGAFQVGTVGKVQETPEERRQRFARLEK